MPAGPRGGGRDRNRIVRHVIRNESEEFAKRVGLKIAEEAALTPEGLKQHRESYVEAMRAYNAGQTQKRMKNWNLPYLIRHSAFHNLDHAWEMEDRTTGRGRLIWNDRGDGTQRAHVQGRRGPAPHQVRFVDTDAFGHVNNAVYLSYFEAAGLLSPAVTGIPFGTGESAGERTCVIAEAHVVYRSPAFFGERLFVASGLTGPVFLHSASPTQLGRRSRRWGGARGRRRRNRAGLLRSGTRTPDEGARRHCSDNRGVPKAGLSRAARMPA